MSATEKSMNEKIAEYKKIATRVFNREIRDHSSNRDIDNTITEHYGPASEFVPLDEEDCQFDIINHTDEENELPIINAIHAINDYAFETILNHPKFNITKQSFLKIHPISIAAAVGHENYLQALMDKGATAKKYCAGTSLISDAIELISCYSVLEYGQFNTKDPITNGNDSNLKRELSDFFYQRGKKYEKPKGSKVGITFQHSGEPIKVYYPGKTNLIEILLANGANPLLSASEGGTKRTPLDILNLDLPLLRFIRSISKKIETSLCLEEQDLKRMAESSIVRLQMNFHNRQADCDPIRIEVYYDMKPVREIIQAHIDNMPKNERDIIETLNHKSESDKQQIQALMHGQFQSIQITVQQHAQRQNNVEAHVAQVATTVQYTQYAQWEQQQQHLLLKKDVRQIQQYVCPHDKEIAELEANPLTEKYFDTLSRNLLVMLEAWRMLSSGKFTKEADTALEHAIEALKTAGDHIPAPFNVVTSIFTGGAKLYSDHKLQEKFKKINNLLPMDRELRVFAREIAYFITNGILARLPNEFYALKIDDAVRAAKRTLVVMIYTINNVDKLNIDHNGPSSNRVIQLNNKILDAMRDPYIDECFKAGPKKSTFMQSLKDKISSTTYKPTSTYEKDSKETPSRPPVPPRPVLYASSNPIPQIIYLPQQPNNYPVGMNGFAYQTIPNASAPTMMFSNQGNNIYQSQQLPSPPPYSSLNPSAPPLKATVQK